MPVEPILLHAVGRTSSATFPYDAVDPVRQWHHRSRVVYAAPTAVVVWYLPLASTTFANLCCRVARGNPATTDVVLVGDLGLHFALDESYHPMVSVEAAALLQLLQNGLGDVHPGEPTPGWLVELQETWGSGQCMFGFHGGWRGCFAEHRLWSAVLLRNGDGIKTPYSRSTVRVWFPKAILDDLVACLGEELVAEVAAAVAENGFDGAPDLALYRPGLLWFVEVKSATDQMKPSQLRMFAALGAIPGVRCDVCCTAAARKRIAATMERFDDEGNETP